ncbi:filamentous hemagglutinin N-terminal domain-containing protein [Adonisia turfae]|uniref:Filamentous hemagglutinin N-terminal domain-containing protein n=1 Tax=Adonisia turfae CCMR0081 TaxID=2292702 RepID=A0A6M0RW43_9CYAN|nr:filamentous hemagglutinin N-terminal domain-containing protein [Adonisia turfae]NEZ60001.1 filamentous hemagglutinin N-terminal domain-containing protein [Adonisia turfae CCMR0081]
MSHQKTSFRIPLGLAILSSSLPTTAQAAALSVNLSMPAQDTDVVLDDVTFSDETEVSIPAISTSPESLSSPSFTPNHSQQKKSDDTLLAQILPDNSLGAEASVITPNVSVNGDSADVIEGGAVRGSSLFHSFQEFNVNDGKRVYFANPAQIRQILGRVTGNNGSDISGTLGVNGPASLFLINPNGIIFGPDAELDITGSFIASTAESFIFPDSNVFSAVNPDLAPFLTMSVAPGLQYGAAGVQPLISEADLSVGQDLTLSGGAVTSNGELFAGGELIVEGVTGNVQVQSVTGRTAFFSANGDLLLNGSQLETVGNLILQATDDVLIQDSLEDPFIASAGVDLVIQADQSINTQDLESLDSSNPDSRLTSGRDLVLRSPLLLLGNRPDPNNALYEVGSYFRTEQLDGTITDLWIPYNDAQVVRANSDIEFTQDYDGSSLYILVGGQVTAENDITIDTIEQGSVVATLLNGQDIVLQSVNLGTFDIRAGEEQLISESFLGTTNLPFINTSIPEVSLIGSPTGSDIILGSFDDGEFIGNNIMNRGGNVVLANHRSSDNLVIGRIDVSSDDGADAGDIILKSINDIIIYGDLESGSVNSSGSARDAGSIYLSSGNNITTQGFLYATSSASSSFFGGSGNGGNISLLANGDIITNDFLSAGSITASVFGNTGNGGAITLSAGRSITNNSNVDVASISSGVSSISAFGDSGNGGAISFLAGGDITSNIPVDSTSSTTSFSSNSGNGGAIFFLADGDINTKNFLSSASFSNFGDAGSGGGIILFATGDVTAGGSILNDGRLGAEMASVGLNTVSLSQLGSSNSGGEINIISGGTITTEHILNSSSISRSRMNATNAGNGGEIILSSDEDIVTKNILNSSSTSNVGTAGNGGDISLSASRDILTEGIDTGLSSNQNINTNNFVSINSSSFSGSGTAGNGGVVSLAAGRNVVSDDLLSFSVSETGMTGNGGNVSLIAREGEIVGNSARLLTLSVANSGGDAGAGGALTLEAQDSISGFEITTLSSTGQSGRVDIAGLSDNFAINDFRLITSGQTEIANPIEDPTDPTDDSITLNLNDFGQAGDTSIIGADNLIFNNVEIQSDSNGSRQAGGVFIESPGQIIFSDSRIDSNANSTGTAGNIEIIAGEGITLQESISPIETGIFARTINDGQGGNITLNTPQLTFNNATEISASTTNSGIGGSITVQSSNPLRMEGEGRLAVESQGENSGRAGNLNVFAPSAVLDNGVTVSASTESQQGGGIINFDIDDVLLLRRGSLINAEATNATGGTAGNIDIDAGFVVAVPDENSDIIANADGGNGGRIDITTNQIFGFEEQSEVNFTTNELRDNSSSDLSASSQAGQQGIIAISTLAPDPNQGLTELPIPSPAPPIQRGCSATSIGNSSFTVTGRGGLPAGPASNSNNDRLLVDLGPDALPPDASANALSDESIPTPSPQIIEAQGWVTDSDGEVIFIAQGSGTSFEENRQPSIQCSGHALSSL